MNNMGFSPARLEKSDTAGTERPDRSDSAAKLAATKKQTKQICFYLSCTTTDFEIEKTVAAIQDIHSSQYLSRILYSEFSNYFFGLDSEGRGMFHTNTENLLRYIDNQEVDEQVQEFVVRIYDHCQLANAQIENIDHMFVDRIEEAKKNIEADSKKLEKEYISILGIFASVVLAFMGGSIFSTSVLQNIANASVYRIILITDFLAFVVVNLVYLLVMFIVRINEIPQMDNMSFVIRKRQLKEVKKKEEKFFPIKAFYLTCFLVALLDITAWIVDFGSLAKFLRDFLPWIS